MLTIMKKLIVVGTFLTVLAFAPKAYAEDTQVLCPQPYGQAVVCGVETHVPVSTGIEDTIPFVGSSFVGASAILAFYSRKLKRQA